MLPDSQRWGRVTQAAPAGPLPVGPLPGDPPAAVPKYGWPAVASVGLVAGVNVLDVTGVRGQRPLRDRRPPAIPRACGRLLFPPGLSGIPTGQDFGVAWIPGSRT